MVKFQPIAFVVDNYAKHWKIRRKCNIWTNHTKTDLILNLINGQLSPKKTQPNGLCHCILCRIKWNQNGILHREMRIYIYDGICIGSNTKYLSQLFCILVKSAMMWELSLFYKHEHNCIPKVLSSRFRKASVLSSVYMEATEVWLALLALLGSQNTGYFLHWFENNPGAESKSKQAQPKCLDSIGWQILLRIFLWINNQQLDVAPWMGLDGYLWVGRSIKRNISK